LTRVTFTRYKSFGLAQPLSGQPYSWT